MGHVEAYDFVSTLLEILQMRPPLVFDAQLRLVSTLLEILQTRQRLVVETSVVDVSTLLEILLERGIAVTVRIPSKCMFQPFLRFY